MVAEVTAEVFSLKSNFSAAEPTFTLQEDVSRIDTPITPLRFTDNRKSDLGEQKTDEKPRNASILPSFHAVVLPFAPSENETPPSANCKSRALHLAALEKVFRERQTWNIAWQEEFCSIHRRHSIDPTSSQDVLLSGNLEEWIPIVSAEISRP
jgi:hypothetical protein